MNERKVETSWWQTMPGILTGIAAVITALGGLVAIVYQSGVFSRDTPAAVSSRPQQEASSPALKVDTSNSASAPPPKETQPGEANQVRAGHFMFKVLSTKVEPYSVNADGSPQKLALRLSIRITDVLGTSDYVDGRTIRLESDGAESSAINSTTFAVYDKQSVDTEAIFVVPADASKFELLLGRPEDAVGRLPLTISQSKNH